MNIGLFGYGKMGRAIEEIALNKGHKIVLKVTNKHDLKDIDLNNVTIDVAIEFSTPEAAYDNIVFCLKNKIPVVSGTTGWLSKLREVEKLTKKLGGGFFYASNFSLGVNLFFKLNRQLAKLLAPYTYTPAIEETHHIYKKDAPSGTAITLAEGIIDYMPQINKWVVATKPGENELPIISHREGEVPGTHKVIYTGEYDRIAIEHEAKNRLGFAIGAVVVAEWIVDKKGVLSMDDFLNELS